MPARLELLRERLQDERSGKVLVLSHCLLNQNVRYLGGAVHPGIVEEVVEDAHCRGYGLYQLPCPEQRAWGGVLKRHLVPAYGAKGTLRYRFPSAAAVAVHPLHQPPLPPPGPASRRRHR